MIIAALAIFQAWIWVGVCIGKLLNDLGVGNILATKLHGLGACYLWLAVCFVALLLGIECSNGVKSAQRETGTE